MSEPLSILFVCTGNICRSPMAERIGRGYAAQAGVAVDFASAGVGAINGQPMHPYTVEVLESRGFDTSDFASRYLRMPMVTSADVVLALTREHRAACQQLAPARWKRSFTLVEFADLACAGSIDDIISARVGDGAH